MTGQTATPGGAPAPTIGIGQRDRRWAATRRFCGAPGLGALVVAGVRGRESFETYLSNESLQGVVVFPQLGEPVYLSWSAFWIIGRSDPDNDCAYWIEDIRAGLLGPLVVKALRELRLERSRIGVVGVASRNPMELEECVPYTVWQHVISELAGCEFVEVSAPYSLLMMEKDEQELALARHCAAVGEQACRAMLEVTRSGCLESDIYAEVLSTIYRAGLTVTAPALIVKSGRDRLSWGPPEWGVAAVPPRRIAEHDLVYAELMPSYGGIETQQEMTVAVGGPGPPGPPAGRGGPGPPPRRGWRCCAPG